MGSLVTLELPDDSPVLHMPWIITFGPLGDEDQWEPVVCGPYERAHAISLAETVVADEQLMAVVEPVLPHASVDEIRSEIAMAQQAAEDDDDDDLLDDDEVDDLAVAVDEEYDEIDDDEEVEAGPPPSPAEIRAGFARIAERLVAAV